MSDSFKLYLYLISIIVLSYFSCFHVMSLHSYSRAAIVLTLPILSSIYYLTICLLHKCENVIKNKEE